jgi:hypothetical protein
MTDLTEREILEKELNIWRTGGQQQQGQPGMGGMSGLEGMFGSGAEEEAIPGTEEELPQVDEYGNPIEENPEEIQDWMTQNSVPKQNMSLDGFRTTKDLDLQLESILKSIEPEVIAAIEKIAPKTSKAQP